jgi:carbon monoxide dehydrogenase subunit G
MKIEGSYNLVTEPATLLNAMLDPVILARCMPGCREIRELELGKYWYELELGYKGTMQINRLISSSRLGRLVISAFSPIIGKIKQIYPGLTDLVKKLSLIPIAKAIINHPPSFLRNLGAEMLMEGKGPTGSLKLMAVVNIHVQAHNIGVEYRGDFYLRGPAAVLQMGNSSLGGLDPQKMFHLFFTNTEKEISAKKQDF